MPSSRNAENPVIELVEAKLATGEGSRLQSRLVDKEQVALNIEAFDEPSLDPYLLFISIQLIAGVTIDRLQSARARGIGKTEHHAGK